MKRPSTPGGDRLGSPVRRAEVAAVLCLASDLGMGVPLEHGLRATLVAIRLAEAMGLRGDELRRVYSVSLLLYIGCTADAQTVAAYFGDEHVMHHRISGVAFGSAGEIARASLPLLGVGAGPFARAALLARAASGGLMREMREGSRSHCEVAELLAPALGMEAEVGTELAFMGERWEGKGFPGRSRGEAIPLAVRIAQVARDADVQRMLLGPEGVAAVIRRRSGRTFDPAVVDAFLAELPAILDGLDGTTTWRDALAAEPRPHAELDADGLDRALAAVGDFVDLKFPPAAGHSRGVAALAGAAGARLEAEVLRRAGLVHDLGRVAVSARVWMRPGPLAPHEGEQVRLHAYWTERVLAPSAALAPYVGVASMHHERLDGSGYHRAAHAGEQSAEARVLAAADAYHAMTEPRPYRDAFGPARAAELLTEEARAGRLDAEAVGAVLEAAGHRRPPVERPAGLTERELEVLLLAARGLATKQIGRALEISPKTADRHLQNLYGKIGVSTRAAAAVFAMQHGLVAWGELPMPRLPGPA